MFSSKEKRKKEFLEILNAWASDPKFYEIIKQHEVEEAQRIRLSEEFKKYGCDFDTKSQGRVYISSHPSNPRITIGVGCKAPRKDLWAATSMSLSEAEQLMEGLKKAINAVKSGK